MRKRGNGRRKKRKPEGLIFEASHYEETSEWKCVLSEGATTYIIPKVEEETLVRSPDGDHMWTISVYPERGVHNRANVIRNK